MKLFLSGMRKKQIFQTFALSGMEDTFVTTQIPNYSKRETKLPKMEITGYVRNNPETFVLSHSSCLSILSSTEVPNVTSEVKPEMGLCDKTNEFTFP